MADPAPVRVGDAAPDFTLPTAAGEPLSLNDFRGREVVLFFYPKDDSPACSTQACAFRDQFERFRDAGVEVIGVSDDSVDSHRRFADRLHLPFHLVSDAGGALRKLFGVPRTLGFIPGRVTYVLDREGVVRHIFSSQLQPRRHVDEALEVLRRLRGEA